MTDEHTHIQNQPPSPQPTTSDPSPDTSARRCFLQRTAGAVGGLSVLGIGAVGTVSAQEIEIQLEYSEKTENAPGLASGQVDVDPTTNEIKMKAATSAINQSAYVSGILYGEYTPSSSIEVYAETQYHREGDIDGPLDLGESSVRVAAFAREHGGGSTGAVFERSGRDVSGTVDKVSDGVLLLLANRTYDIGVLCDARINPSVTEPIESIDFFDDDRGFQFQDYHLRPR